MKKRRGIGMDRSKRNECLPNFRRKRNTFQVKGSYMQKLGSM